MAITASDFQNIELAISAYTDEAYTDEKVLVGTEIVSTDPRIDVNGESYIGQMRSYDPVNATYNTPSLTTATDGAFSTFTTQVSTFIKGATSIGMDQVNLQKLISKQDAFDKFARDLARVKANDRNAVVVNTLKGLAAYEASVGAGINDWTDVNNPAVGFFVDINAVGHFGAAATGASDERKLIDASAMGAARGSRLFQAMGLAYGDYEPDFLYMVTSPETMAELREANLVDETTVTDGNLEFQTIFGGKFRLLLTRTSQGNFGPLTNVNARSVKTTFLVRPGALAFAPIMVENDTEIDRDASTYFGGGNTEIWHRWAHVVHPIGYSWNGSTTAFAAAANYATGTNWVRKAAPLNLGVLPIFHS
jgi:hypothetical protein